jgi:hypothetical protein
VSDGARIPALRIKDEKRPSVKQTSEIMPIEADALFQVGTLAQLWIYYHSMVFIRLQIKDDGEADEANIRTIVDITR